MRVNHSIVCSLHKYRHCTTILDLHTHPPIPHLSRYSNLFPTQHTMNTINLLFQHDRPSAPPTHPPVLRLHCPVASCNQHIPWDKVGLMLSKTTYTCPHCQSAFCLACEKPPSTYSDHEPTSKCLLNSTTTGGLSNLLFFHEALLVFKDLCKTRKQFELWQQGDISDPKFMSDVDDAVERTNTIMENSNKIVDDFYTMIIQAEKKRAKAEYM